MNEQRGFKMFARYKMDTYYMLSEERNIYCPHIM